MRTEQRNGDDKKVMGIDKQIEMGQQVPLPFILYLHMPVSRAGEIASCTWSVLKLFSYLNLLLLRLIFSYRGIRAAHDKRGKRKSLMYFRNYEGEWIPIQIWPAGSKSGSEDSRHIQMPSWRLGKEYSFPGLQVKPKGNSERYICHYCYALALSLPVPDFVLFSQMQFTISFLYRKFHAFIQWPRQNKIENWCNVSTYNHVN